MQIASSLSTVAVIVLLAIPAFGFPPAPGVAVFGLVRDEHGWAIDDASARIVFTSGERELHRAALKPGLGTNVNENYRVLLPLDMEGGDDAYRPAVVGRQLPFSVHVEVGGQRFLPMETFLGLTAPDDPGSVFRLDFTLGEDRDEDGLPDPWEYWQLEVAGISSDDANYNLDQLGPEGDADGDGVSNRDEYNAGTYAMVFSDHFALWPIRVYLDGWLEFEFEGVVDKSYLFECSEDLDVWNPVGVGIWMDREDLRPSYRPTRTGKVRVIAPPPTEQLKFFRVTVS